MITDNNFAGRSGFYWWQGVVEDRIDPEKLGRLKIRIFGAHTKDKSFIKSEDLHWAFPIQSFNSASKNGIGFSPTGPVPGTWVFGFYHDGEDMQEPVVLGTISGVPQDTPNPNEGFNDPRDTAATSETLSSAPRKIFKRIYRKDGSGAELTPESKAVLFPRDSHPLGCIIAEPDTNRIARAEKIDDTIIQVITDNIDSLVPIAFGGTWDEPGVWYHGQYPFVHVYESESGHIVVTDDTPDYEGTLNWDRTGTFTETLTDGSKVQKIVKDNYTIILKDDHIHVIGTKHQRVDHRCTLSVGGVWDVEVTGNINITSHQDINLTAQNVNINAKQNINANCGGDLNVNAQGNASIHSGGNLNVTSDGQTNLTAGASMFIRAAGIVDIEGADVIINSKHPVLV